MKKWILQQSDPSDNSPQSATEVPLAPATEQGLCFFSKRVFLLLPFPPPHTTWATDCVQKHHKTNNCLHREVCGFFPPLFYILICDPNLDPRVSDRNIDISRGKIEFLYTGDESCKLCCVDRTTSHAGGSFWWPEEGLNNTPAPL